MTANNWLIVFLIAFWVLCAAGVKFDNWSAGKRWSDGPSLFPLIPTLPGFAFAVGWVVNEAISPWGSWGIAGLHFLVFSIVLIGGWLYPSDDQQTAR